MRKLVSFRRALSGCPDLQCVACLSLEAVYNSSSPPPEEHSGDVLVLKSLKWEYLAVDSQGGVAHNLPGHEVLYTFDGGAVSPFRALSLPNLADFQGAIAGTGKCAGYSLPREERKRTAAFRPRRGRLQAHVFLG